MLVLGFFFSLEGAQSPGGYAYVFLERVENSENMINVSLEGSDMSVWFRIRVEWAKLLAIRR